jgi:hypothetical protein
MLEFEHATVPKNPSHTSDLHPSSSPEQGRPWPIRWDELSTLVILCHWAYTYLEIWASSYYTLAVKK